MKLLYCLECHDVVRLFRNSRSCECGATGGQYVDDNNAEVFGEGIPFAIATDEFDAAIAGRTEDWPGVWFRGFVIPFTAKTIVKV